MKDLEQIKTNFASLETKYKESKGYCETKPEEYASDYLYAMIQNTNRYLNHLEQNLYSFQREHLAGHLPAIKSPGKLEGALKALGIADDYKVEKPTIYATASRNTYEVDFQGKLKSL